MTSPRADSRTGLLLPLVPAAAWAAFPFFSDFSTAKLLVVSLLAVPLWWAVAARSVPWRSLSLPLLYLAVSLPAFWHGPGDAAVRQALLLELVALVVWWAAAQAGAELLKRLPGWLLAAGIGVLLFRAGEWLWPTGPLAIGALPGSATLGNPDLTAEFIAVLVPVALWQLTRGEWPGRLAAALVLLGAGPVLFFHHSLTAALAALAGGATLIFLLLAGRWQWQVVVGLAALAALLALAFVPAAREEAAGRAYLYGRGLEVALERPLSGHGEGGFGLAFMDAQGAALERQPALRSYWTNARDAHCAPLHLWAERGIGAALMLLVLWGVALWRSRQGPRWQMPVLLALFVASAGSISWQQVPFHILAYLLMGASWPARLEGASGHWRRAIAVVVALAAPAGAGWYAAADAAMVRQDLERAHRWLPDHARIQFALGQLEAAQRHDERAAALLESSLEAHPNLSTLLTLGNIETRRGNYERAEAWYRRLLDWKPDFAAGYANLAWLYHEWDKPELADRHLTRALSLRPSDPAILRIRDAMRQ